jgi:integrase
MAVCPRRAALMAVSYGVGTSCLQLSTASRILSPSIPKTIGRRSLAKVVLKYVNIFRDRHGRERAYYRRNGKREPLPLPVGSPEFLQAYDAKRKRDGDKRPSPPGRKTFNDLAAAFFSSTDFHNLRPSTQKNYRSSLRWFLKHFGTGNVPTFTYDMACAIIEDMSDRPVAANKLLKRLRQMMKLAKRKGWIEKDPTEGISYYKEGEIHTWTADEHKRFMDYWQPGTMPRLAYMAHLHTAQRRSDVVNLPMPKAREDGFRLVQVKTGVKLHLPCPMVLWEEIQRHDRRVMLIETSFGKPFTSNGYGNWFRERCRDAGMPERCSSHGLRKAAATELAEAGCSAKEIQAVTGHASLKEVERYTRAADQARLARQAEKKRSGTEER